MAGIALVILCLSFFDPPPSFTGHSIRYVDVAVAQIRESPEGVVICFRVANRTQWRLAQLDGVIQLTSRAAPEHPSFSQPFSLKDVADQSAPEVELRLAGWTPQDLFGWKGQITGFQLPPGRTNRRLQQTHSVRISGQGGNVPIPFEEAQRPRQVPPRRIDLDPAVPAKPNA